jgi:hypothetical protein
LFVIAIFLERAQEVFVSTWRAFDRRPYEKALEAAKANQADARDEKSQKDAADAVERAEEKLAGFKENTKRRMFLFGLGAGLTISLVGVRVLRPLTDVTGSSSVLQERLFDSVDIMLTGAMIGGGSDGIHKLMSVITDYLDIARKRIRAADPDAAGAGGKN